MSPEPSVVFTETRWTEREARLRAAAADAEFLEWDGTYRIASAE